MNRNVEIKRCWVQWPMVGFGVTQFTCFSPVFVGPVGVAWTIVQGRGNAGKLLAESLGSYVVPWARRQGIRSLINEQMFKSYGIDVITTQNGSDEGGLAFMKHWRYRLDAATGVWSLTRRTWQRRSRELANG